MQQLRKDRLIFSCHLIFFCGNIFKKLKILYYAFDIFELRQKRHILRRNRKIWADLCYFPDFVRKPKIEYIGQNPIAVVKRKIIEKAKAKNFSPPERECEIAKSISRMARISLATLSMVPKFCFIF